MTNDELDLFPDTGNSDTSSVQEASELAFASLFEAAGADSSAPSGSDAPGSPDIISDALQGSDTDTAEESSAETDIGTSPALPSAEKESADYYLPPVDIHSEMPDYLSDISVTEKADDPAFNYSFPVETEKADSSRNAPAADIPHKKTSGKGSRNARTIVRKIRPKNTTGEGLFGIPNILVTGVWCGLILLIGLTLGRMLWLCAAEVLAFGREDRAVTIQVTETDTIDDIARQLQRNELIHYPGVFKLYASFAVDEGDIHPGTWELNTKYDYHALVKGMAPSSTRSVVKVMIPEGYTCRQIFALLEENKVCSAAAMAQYAASGDLGNYWFLDQVNRGSEYCLEGYLFPDTYEFYTNDSPKSVLTKMLNNFDAKFDDNLRWQINQLNQTLENMMRRSGKSEAFISEHLFNVRDVIIVASMIEKETSSAEEGHTIASVIYNRLFRWDAPAYLNIDASIVYALGGKTELSAADMQIDSPYNTYKRTGLTPGPIANPGLSSLKAALDPANTDYYYYVLDRSTGSHVFATTQAQHDENVARVRAQEAQ